MTRHRPRTQRQQRQHRSGTTWAFRPLLDLGSAKVEAMIQGRTPGEIRKQFNIAHDFTPEEEAQVREENAWIEAMDK